MYISTYIELRSWPRYFRSCGVPGGPEFIKKRLKIDPKISQYFKWFWAPFWLHFGSKTRFKIIRKILKNPVIFPIGFWVVFRRSWPRFCLHFGSLNRPRRRSGAKRSTFDFEQQSKHFQWFWPRGVPGDSQNQPRNLLRNPIRFSIDFWSQNQPKIDPKGYHFGDKKASKNQ